MNAILSIAMASNVEFCRFPTEQLQNSFIEVSIACILRNPRTDLTPIPGVLIVKKKTKNSLRHECRIFLLPKQSCLGSVKTRELYSAMKTKLLESSDVESVTCTALSLKLHGGLLCEEKDLHYSYDEVVPKVKQVQQVSQSY